MALVVLDANGDQQNMSTTTDGSGNQVGSSCVTDPATGFKQAVNADHLSDGQALPGYSAQVSAVEMLWNGATYDRRRGNVDAPASLVTLNASGAGTLNSPDQVNYNGRGVQIGINITAISGTSPTVQVTIQGKDAVSGAYYTLLQSANLTATGFTLLTLYPGVAATANVAASQVLPRSWRVNVVVGGTGVSCTATIGASTIV